MDNTLYCGIDWAENHHDIAVVDVAGTVVARNRVSNDSGGFAAFLDLMAKAGDTAEAPVPVAIETDRGLWVAALRATGRPVLAINPLAASRYRSRHQVSGAKSDAADAVMLANIARTDADAHRLMGADTELAQAVRVLARAQQDAVWERTRIGQQIRAVLKQFYPAALNAIEALPEGGLARADARTVLMAAPTPADAQRLSLAKLRGLLKRAGRARYIDRDATALRQVFRAEQLRQPATVETAIGIQLSALLGQYNAAIAAEENLAEAVSHHFDQHPDAEVITSFPGLSRLTDARVLAEIGNDRTKFTSARALKAYAGSAPITRASGKKTVVMHRHINNRRLNTVGPIWTLVALRFSPGAGAHYQRQRDAGDWHRSAQRNLFNRLLGCLYHCLQTGTLYDELHAFPPPSQTQA